MTKRISLAALVFACAAAGEVSRDGFVGERHFDGYARHSNWNENDKLIYGRTVINLQR